MTPNPMSRTFFFVVPYLLVAGCCQATVSVVPKEGNTAEAISTSAKEECAIEKAKAEAEEYCKKQGKHFYATTVDTKYQGADPNAKLAVGMLSNNRRSLNTADDYRTEMEFRCE